jgi:hypothetical protein
VVVVVSVALVKIIGSALEPTLVALDSPSTTLVSTVGAGGAIGTTVTAPPVTAAPLTTRPPQEEQAARRKAFIEQMKSMGLTEAQATCAADRVENSIGWADLGESIMDPGKPGQLQEHIVACVRE